MVAEAASPDEGTGHLMCNRGGGGRGCHGS